MLPIAFADVGEEYVIKKVGGNEETRRHLADLGVVVGGDATLISIASENVILKVKETRIALGKDMAQKIMV